MNTARLAAESSAFLDALAPWTFFATLTHRTSVPLDEVAAELRRWAEGIARELREHVHLAWCVEHGGRFGRAHSHALVAPWSRPSGINHDFLARMWARSSSAGRSEIRPYVAGGGAGPYGMKADRWNYGIVCPRQWDCRRRCLAGPHPFLH